MDFKNKIFNLMKINNLYLVSLLLMVFLSISCQHEEIRPKLSDARWNVSTNGNIGITKYASFVNLSQGSTYSAWILDDSTKNQVYFLDGNIKITDLDYTKFIREDQSRISSDNTIHLLFNRAGEYEVNLYNSFEDSVYYIGNDTINAEFIDGEWQIAKTFTIDVYDSIQAAVEVYNGNEELLYSFSKEELNDLEQDTTKWPVIDVEAGGYLELVDSTKVGRPTARSWIASGAQVSDQGAIRSKVNYYSLGTFTTAISSNRSGDGIPTGYAFRRLPYYVNVIQSSHPFQIVGSLKELPDQTIQVTTNGEISKLINEEDNFKVVVENDNGFKEQIKVLSATIDSRHKYLINLKLAGEIYNSDRITVSWDGDISSRDERKLEAFEDVPVEMYVVDLCEDQQVFGFEAGSLMASNWAFRWDTPMKTAQVIPASQAPAGVHENSKYVLEVDVDNGASGRVLMDTKTKLPLVKGQMYTFSYRYNTPSDNPSNVGGSPIFLPWSVSGYPSLWVNYGKSGQWTSYSKTFEYTGSDVEINFMLTFFLTGGDNGLSKVYIDNLSLILAEPRP
ncbi:hypothetical protein [Persicobacter psychrovividus]